MIVAVKVRSDIDARKKAKDILKNLNLEKTNQCVVFEKSDSVMGMLQRVKDYTAFGEVSDETLEKLSEIKGNKIKNGDTIDLSPPTKGYKSTKKQVGQGGSLGNRDDMDELLGKMGVSR